MSQIIIGFTTEGSTDIRFLSSIIQRTFVAVGFECTKEIEIIEPVIHIEKKKGSFAEQILTCSKDAFSKGVMVFCIHVDADGQDDVRAFETQINPALALVIEELNACTNVVPVVPVQMTESWMLADKNLLKEEIGTDMTDSVLGISRHPESIPDPKETIAEAIRIARAPLGKRRRKDLNISELYLPIGQKISLEILDTLESYQKFKDAVRNAYRQLNYLK
ncbi:MAG: DUF4276 family protein [Bacteroidota bacterium]